MRSQTFLSFLAGAALWLGASARADEIPVAVAANFTQPFQQLVAGFEQESGHKVLASYGATGKFFAQIRHGAPFEVLLAADDETPARLVSEKAAVPGTAFSYAIGRLVLWSAKPGAVDERGEVLRQGGFRHLAITNPRLAPYGAASVEAMKALGVYEALAPKLLMAETTTQAHQFVSSGNSELGFVALSQVFRDGAIQGSGWLVPSRLHAPIRQDAVLLLAGQGKAGPMALLAYLRGAKARAVIRSYGYELGD